MALMHRVEGPTRTLRAVPRAARHAVFIDKDGTLVHDVPYNVDPALLRFTPHALEGLQLLGAAGYRLVVVTNQPGIALGRFDKAALRNLHAGLARLLREQGISLAGFFACPHAPPPAGQAPNCGCRKPAPGMLQEAGALLGIDMAHSWMVGDILDDVEAGHRAGCRSVLLDVGNETLWQRSPLRLPDVVAADLREAAQEIIRRDRAGRGAGRAARAAGHVHQGAL